MVDQPTSGSLEPLFNPATQRPSDPATQRPSKPQDMSNVYVSRFHPLNPHLLSYTPHRLCYLSSPLRCCADRLLYAQFDITVNGVPKGRIVFKLFDGTYGALWLHERSSWIRN